MEDLDDHMLHQILLRLPSCKTVLACSPVNKRLCSLISDPNFHVQFANHKKKTIALLKGSGSNHDDDEPPCTFIIIKDSWTKLLLITEFIFGPPKSPLEILPCDASTTRATFKDLVLCTDYENRQVYYITNPLTKQWVALPPRPYQWKPIKSTALICQTPYNHTQDYKFRVVEIRHPPMYHSLESSDACYLVIYCSEIGEWNEINLRVPQEAGPNELRYTSPDHVVCNSIIYFKSGLCLVALDPFDVNASSDTTIEARVMPPLPDFGHLLESSGQLFVVHTPQENSQDEPCLLYEKDGTAIELQMVVWKLDLNRAPLVWETTFRGLCKGTVNETESACYPSSGVSIFVTEIGVHPYNDKLIYVHLSPENQFVLCNTRTRCITPLKTLSYHALRSTSIYRIEHQWWPTLVPACTMPHNRAELADTTASER